MKPLAPGCQDPYRKALNSALRILAHRDHTAAELIRKLERRGFAESVIGAVLRECRRVNYLDDARAALQLVDQLKRRGWGLHRIRSEMAKKGLSGPEHAGLLRECLPAGEELRFAQQVMDKRAAAFDREPDAERRKIRIQRFLRSRGFSDTVIFDLLRGS
jgi:regulatory protein